MLTRESRGLAIRTPLDNLKPFEIHPTGPLTTHPLRKSQRKTPSADTSIDWIDIITEETRGKEMNRSRYLRGEITEMAYWSVDVIVSLLNSGAVPLLKTETWENSCPLAPLSSLALAVSDVYFSE